MADFDFTGLTEAHRRLLDRGGWTVAEASADNVQPITGAALAAELEVDPRTARAILDELRAAELAPPAVVAGASGRRMAAAPAPGKVVRVPQVVLERLAAATGRPVGEDVVGQIAAVLDRGKA